MIAGGCLYVMGWEGGQDHVRCLEAKTGELVWDRFLPSVPAAAPGAPVGDENAYSGPTSTPPNMTLTRDTFTP